MCVGTYMTQFQKAITSRQLHITRISSIAAINEPTRASFKCKCKCTGSYGSFAPISCYFALTDTLYANLEQLAREIRFNFTLFSRNRSFLFKLKLLLSNLQCPVTNSVVEVCYDALQLNRKSTCLIQCRYFNFPQKIQRSQKM